MDTTAAPQESRAGAEHRRLADHEARRADWKQWGPYLSERAWGTVREDYSAEGDAWGSFPHDHARSRAYRWNEDGLAGISDRSQYLCLAVALWNGTDPILKERLFGLTGPQGNHGEDVKECYWYLDATPTHSYLRMRYRYPQSRFPYDELEEQNRDRPRDRGEHELLDTGVFDDGRYFDVDVTYAKADERDILMRVEVANRGPDDADIWVLPTLWFRNTWSWGYPRGPMGDVPGRPSAGQHPAGAGAVAVRADHPAAGSYYWYAEGADRVLFTENETNTERLYGIPSASPHTKDAFHRYVVDGRRSAVNPERRGTKAAALYRRTVPAGESVTLRLRLTDKELPEPFADHDEVFARRAAEADEFAENLEPAGIGDEERRVWRGAMAGMIWSKQLYYYDVAQWLDGDPAGPPPPEGRCRGRNAGWRHLNNFDILSMPDAWEYPWYAAWDLAFHCIPLATLDPAFAKRQLQLMTREWYMHPNGQLPAYEWRFEDVNPPVHAWATLDVYRIDAAAAGEPDLGFLEGVFHKLLLNFTWWVNRKDAEGDNVFQGGFLGLDNVSVFDRSHDLPGGGTIDQSDGTAWMAFYTLGMLRIALELAMHRPVYQDIATKFYEHFLSIADALVAPGHCLWDPEEGFFHDILRLPDGTAIPLKVRSVVGLLPLVAVELFDDELLDRLPDFTRRMRWFTQNRPHLAGNMASIEAPGAGRRHLLSVLTRERLELILQRLLDEEEFLSPHGIRSLSRAHRDRPFSVTVEGVEFSVGYEPGESATPMFGGNSNWRGPVWFPINFLLIEALESYHRYYGDDLTVEFPTGSGERMTLDRVARAIARRLVSLFLPGPDGNRPMYGGDPRFRDDPGWRDLLVFPEYFHGDHGVGLGAMHQTGWTGLVATLIERYPGIDS